MEPPARRSGKATAETKQQKVKSQDLTPIFSRLDPNLLPNPETDPGEAPTESGVNNRPALFLAVRRNVI